MKLNFKNVFLFSIVGGLIVWWVIWLYAMKKNVDDGGLLNGNATAEDSAPSNDATEVPSITQ